MADLCYIMTISTPKRRKAEIMKRGNIIVLNGVSSSGKSTFAKALQAKFTQQYLYMPVDLLNDISPAKDSKSYNERFAADPMPILSAFYSCVKSFSDYGINVIFDVVFRKSFLNWFLNLFSDSDVPVMMVHVTCPIEELRRRENKRSDRKVGDGESHLALLEPRDCYDIVIDTYAETTEVNVEKVINLSTNISELTSFKTLWLSRSDHMTF
jgi:chloramphenicol 3-O phosphotransferase